MKTEELPTKEDLVKKHESKVFPGSNDNSRSTIVSGITLEVKRPKEGDMYGLFITEKDGTRKEVSMIGGSTAEAEKVFDKAKEILEKNLKIEEAEKIIREYILEIHGGLQ